MRDTKETGAPACSVLCAGCTVSGLVCVTAAFTVVSLSLSLCWSVVVDLRDAVTSLLPLSLWLTLRDKEARI